MQQPTATSYPISDLLEWRSNDQLVVAPRFQRRTVWGEKARSYLIDSILRAMPIPPLLIRLRTDPSSHRTIREVVDGQQRVRAILDFLDNAFPVLRVHHQQYGGRYFRDLPDDVQWRFMRYRVLMNLLDDVDDRDVLQIFARINTHTIVLNGQEIRNAEFFGEFKQLAYQLAWDFHDFLLRSGILSLAEMTRMADAELVSELLAAMLGGLRAAGNKELGSVYARYDESLPARDRLADEFGETIKVILELVGDDLKTSPFRRRALFYTLYCFVYDARFGLPGSSKPRLTFQTNTRGRVAGALRRIGAAIEKAEPPEPYRAFKDAASHSPGDAGRRRLRHEMLWHEALAEAD